MLQANQARIEWDSEKKHWHVTIQVGAEAVKRWNATKGQEADDDALRTIAVETARDEGYALDRQRVSITR
ncbi:MAG: hypothetical protein ACLQVN_11620 [Bryobacteraceae bacterium]